MKLISNNLDKPAIGEIWILLDSRLFGGIESHVIELARGLIAFGHKARVVLTTEYSPAAQIVQKAKEAAIPVSYLNYLSGEPNKALKIKHLTSAVANNQPSVVHSHGYKASILSRCAKLLTRTFPRLISTYHVGESSSGKLWLYDWLDRSSGSLSDHCFAVSPSIQRKVFCSSELLNNFVSIPNSQLNYQEIAFVGRLSQEKGADQFIEVARLCPTLQFSVYGDGPEKESLNQTAPPNVTFFGHQTDMEGVWENISVLIISSRYEGLPMAALEAMSRGIAVMSLRVGRLPDIIQTGKNGFIVEDIPSLAKCLHDWMSIGEAQQSLIRQNARQTIIDDFSAQSVIPVLLQKYQIETDH
ncbi:glycosyltransferase family 4 protein [Vibrio sp. YT-18]|uniref:glycosyltransferase family 4 protein n=1 Tax=Vibrio sp. YT-18 TaxID=3074709 RepID=UPI00296478C3|nr:glycosyltransferase family 4 protein [Vibrio sp. YT-18]MDW1550640.1 glycosyltransferase family 4 protein [Vibrio sp. YT-18]